MEIISTMALIHPLSAPAAPECLELFDLAPTQTGVLGRYQLELAPIAAPLSGNVEFAVRTDTPDYPDLKQTKISGKVRVVKSDGQPMGADDLAMLNNLFALTMWKQVDVKIGNVILSLPEQMFMYKALFKVLLTRSAESKETQLASLGFYKEKAGSMDDQFEAENATGQARAKLVNLSKWVDFEGPLLEDCLEVDRYLLNNVPISVKLTPASDAFNIRAKDETKKYKLEIADLKLMLSMVTVSPGVILGHANALKTTNAFYPHIRGEMKNHSIAKGERNVTLYNISTKSLPSRLVFGMVSAEAYNGKHTKNPFKFDHFDIGDVSLVVNEKIIGGQPLTLNFDEDTVSGRSYVNAYNRLFSGTGTEGKDFGNDITIEDFAKGYTLFCYNLEPFDNPGKYFNLIKTGFVKLSLQFNKPLPETVVLIIYTEHQDMYQIDAARNVMKG